MSLQFELKRIVFLSGVKDHCSTSQFPGVSNLGAAAFAESAYQMLPAAASLAITMVSFAAQ